MLISEMLKWEENVCFILGAGSCMSLPQGCVCALTHTCMCWQERVSIDSVYSQVTSLHRDLSAPVETLAPQALQVPR